MPSKPRVREREIASRPRCVRALPRRGGEARPAVATPSITKGSVGCIVLRIPEGSREGGNSNAHCAK